MTAQCVMSPDTAFIKEVMDNGGENVNKCYQCATCSVVCDVTPNENPFPRKEMLLTQWGWKERLFSSPNIWLCHQCQDCTVHCPRDAKPGNVLASLRQNFIKYYAMPRFMYRLVHDKNMLGTALAIPTFILAMMLIVLWQGGLLNEHPGPVHYANMMPHLALNTVFTVLVFLAAFVFAVAVFRYWTSMAKQAGISCTLNMTSLKKAIVPAVKEMVTHEQFSKCTTDKWRYVAHLLLFFAFLGLLLVTIVAIFYIVFFHYYPLPLTNVFKILGNLSALAFLTGIALMIYSRLAGSEREKIGAGSWADWLLLGILGTVGLTGLLCEILRFADWPFIAYPMYFIHLVAVFCLLIYSPYTKFAHVVYRSVAIVFSKYLVFEREQGINVCT